MKLKLLVLSVISILALAAGVGGAAVNVTWENDYARFVIDKDGRTASIIDKGTGVDYARKPGAPFAILYKDETAYPATSASGTSDEIKVEFGESGVSAVMRIVDHKRHSVLEVVSVSSNDIDRVVFADFYLDLKQPISACALALNLKTNVEALPHSINHLQAICYPRFGLAGAQVALLVCPQDKLRQVMQEAVLAAPELPHSPLGGPWALDPEINRGSYLMNLDGITEENVDEWIESAKGLGITQIDFHGGLSFRFGDCVPNPTLYPNGRASFKAVIDKLHEAGIMAGLHTYAFFMDKGAKWVTPVPDPRLGKDATFTLAKDMGETDDVVEVLESTEKMSTVTGFFVHNSVTLQIDDELIVYSDVSKEPPYAFTKCQRGACGTKVSTHAAGAKVHHLKECFGIFTPDGDSTLLDEVAAATADFYNECGFDMIYLDALDGEGILGGFENGWHYGSKFVFQIVEKLKKPALMEMSIFHHHLWYVRSRMGAWDNARRSYKKFIDIHCAANKGCEAMFMPKHLGWWGTISGLNNQQDIMFSDDMEYLMCKCIANDCGMSQMVPNLDNLSKTPLARRYGALIKRYEDYRHSGAADEKIKARLGEPGADFSLEDAGDKLRFREKSYSRHKVENLDWAGSWSVSNSFKEQPVKLRIEALYSVAPYDSPQAVVLEDFSDPAKFGDKDAAPEIEAELASSKEQVKVGENSGLIAACRPGVCDDDERTAVYSITEHGTRQFSGGRPSWAKFGTKYEPARDLSATQGLGVWVYGDGKGEVLNFQLKSPTHLVAGFADHYITVDFTGWRYFELVESEGERCEDCIWPYASMLYSVYREPTHFNSIEWFNVWINNLPADSEAKCYISPVKALPLLVAQIKNPSVTIDGKKIVFPVEMESGNYLEYYGPDDCKLYNAEGAVIAEVKPDGDAPVMKNGGNVVRFDCESADGITPRANVTVIGNGELL